MKGKRSAGRHSADAGDADGIEALLSLANVAQEASYNQESGAFRALQTLMHVQCSLTMPHTSRRDLQKFTAPDG